MKKNTTKKSQKHPTPQSPTFTATVDGNARGFAFLIIDGCDKDMFVPASGLNCAMHRDTVLARHVAGTTDEAEVVSVVVRGIKELVGTFDRTNGGNFVIPDERKLTKDIYIPRGADLKAKNGQKVVVRITKYPTSANTKPEGEVIQLLGYAGEHNTDMVSVAVNYGISCAFPADVSAYAEKIPREVSDISGRLDLTADTIFTIDGADAKDLDDAVSIRQLKNGNYVLGVHIADVSSYVKPQDVVDREAFARATSVYLPGMVFPMLPTALSNGICSLYEGVTRLTLSCIMTINRAGDVVDFSIAESAIKSVHRTTYDEVQGILDGDVKCVKKYSDIVESVRMMEKLAAILIKKRDNRGNIDFSTKEVQFEMDDNGEVVNILPYPRLFSHRIIEEFMIIANETVAQYAATCKVPFVYRTHETPDKEKLDTLFALLRALGIAAKRDGDVDASALQKLLKKTENTPYFPLVNDVMLRTMQKAKYTTENVGHFGLASDCYCHFTSPIRRYPDLIVHRVLKTLIKRKFTAKATAAYKDMCRDTAVQASSKERNAMEAERKADDIKKCQYARRLVGEKQQGIISGVTEHGIFVELSNTVEGYITTDRLSTTGLKFDKARFCLYNDAVKYTLGSQLTVIIDSVNMAAAKIDMKLG